MTTEHDVRTMERLHEAVTGGEVTTEEQWQRLCRNLQATNGHIFSVLMTLGGKMPWDRGG